MWAAGAALAAHALLVLSLPDGVAPRSVQTPTALVWMTPPADNAGERTPVNESTPAPRARASVRHAKKIVRKSIAASSASAGLPVVRYGSEAIGAENVVASGSENSGAGGGAGEALIARKPRLLTVTSPCRGYFPAQASIDHGIVRLEVQVDANGHTRGSRLLEETAHAHQFAAAASACAAALQFAPAIDTRGIAIASDAKLELRFDRS